MLTRITRLALVALFIAALILPIACNKVQSTEPTVSAIQTLDTPKGGDPPGWSFYANNGYISASYSSGKVYYYQGGFAEVIGTPAEEGDWYYAGVYIQVALQRAHKGMGDWAYVDGCVNYKDDDNNAIPFNLHMHGWGSGSWTYTLDTENWDYEVMFGTTASYHVEGYSEHTISDIDHIEVP